MTEEERWKTEFRLKQDHVRVLTQIRDELCRIANAMATVEDEEMESTDDKEKQEDE